MDRLASMNAFVKAVDSGSLAAAARALGMSPQMVAKHLAYLESRIGTRLLNRTTRRQSLTEVGATYYERCKVVLAEVDWADAVADQTRGKPRGLLRINAPLSFGAHSLMPVVARYLEQHPDVEIDLDLTDRYVDLVEEGFEAVFRIGPLAASSVPSRALSPFRKVACASPAYLRDCGIPSTPADLGSHRCLAFASPKGPLVDDWDFHRDGTAFSVPIRSRLRVNNATAILNAALEGFGIALIAETLARPFLLSGQLVRVLGNYETPAVPMHLLLHTDRRQTPKLKSFTDVAIGAFGPASSDNEEQAVSSLSARRRRSGATIRRMPLAAMRWR